MVRHDKDTFGDGTVRARLNYSVDTGQPAVDMVKAPGEGRGERTGVVFDPHDVTVRDGRPSVAGFDLDREGVVLREHRTAVKNFYDDAEVVSAYYPEAEAVVKAATGADKVLVFDHTIRIDDEARQAALKVRAPVQNMHNDFAEISAPRRVRDLLPADEAEIRLKKRYGSINVWRSINGPVETRPLVVCDARSIDDHRDWIAVERHYADRVGVTLNLRYNPGHRWYYFPGLDEDEAVLFKNYDSRTDGTARFTAHGSFRHPHTRPDARRRQSIEVRTLMFWD